MRKILALVVCTAALGGQSLAPVVGDINFYGLHKISAQHILSTLKLRSGERLPASKADLQERLENLSGVVLGRIEAVCCDGPRVTLFIGVEERGAPHSAFRSDPSGNALLPDDLVLAYNQYLGAVAGAAARGSTGEDLSEGHSLMDDPSAWAFQQRFLAWVPQNLALLHDVLHDGSIASQRAIAASLIGYSPNKPQAIEDLEFALTDPDPAVRANALRSLTAIAVLAAKQPALKLQIAPVWLIELLNSVELTDRVETVKALLALTEGTPGPNARPEAQAALDLVRERALGAVLDMARWKTPSYALPPFVLAGRLAGMNYVDTLQAWAGNDRESVLTRAAGSGAGKRKTGGTLQ